MRELKQQRISRRKFIRNSLGTVSLSGLAAAMVEQPTLQSQTSGTNRFAYDVGGFAKTDPKLIQYQEVRRFSAPHGDARRLSMGPGDHVYVAAGSFVNALDAQGASQLELALPAPARCLTLAASGLIYVGLRDRVEVFDAKGQHRDTWAVPGDRSWLTALALNDNSLFAADAGHRLILRYDLSGKLVRRIGEKNKELNVPGFIVPSPYFDVKLHQDGLLRATNPGRHRVEAYTVDGEFERSWGKASAAIEGFCGCCNPISLALSPDGKLITCEKGLPRVKVYQSDGSLESVVAGPESFPENLKTSAGDGRPDGMLGGLDAAVDSSGQVYVLDRVTSEIRVMVRKGEELKAAPAKAGPGV